MGVNLEFGIYMKMRIRGGVYKEIWKLILHCLNTIIYRLFLDFFFYKSCSNKSCFIMYFWIGVFQSALHFRTIIKYFKNVFSHTDVRNSFWKTEIL